MHSEEKVGRWSCKGHRRVRWDGQLAQREVTKQGQDGTYTVRSAHSMLHRGALQRPIRIARCKRGKPNDEAHSCKVWSEREDADRHDQPVMRLNDQGDDDQEGQCEEGESVAMVLEGLRVPGPDAETTHFCHIPSPQGPIPLALVAT